MGAYKLNPGGFTLLELVIVIVIAGVLAGLALPRFLATVEYSRSTEALASLGAIRQAMERCYLRRNGSYVGCELSAGAVNTLDIEDPTYSVNTHFSYDIEGQSATGYSIIATRNGAEGGEASSKIYLIQGSATVTRTGTGKFSGIQ